MNHDDLARLMENIDSYESIEWNPKVPPENADRAFQRDVLIEWQQGIIWLEIHDNGVDRPQIVVRHLRGIDCIPMGVLAQANGNMHRLAGRPGGIMPKVTLGDTPAAEAITLIIERIPDAEMPEEVGPDVEATGQG